MASNNLIIRGVYMKATRIADSVRYESFDKSWAVIFREVGGTDEGFITKPGFNSREEAEGFLKGWNSHRSNVSEALFVSLLKREN
jgi:hypothetical protein